MEIVILQHKSIILMILKKSMKPKLIEIRYCGFLSLLLAPYNSNV